MRVSYANFFENLYKPKHEFQAKIFYYRCDKFIKNYEQNIYIGMANWGLEVANNGILSCEQPMFSCYSTTENPRNAIFDVMF